MAIKSKNIKHNKITKLIAIVLAVVMFFSAGWFANLFIRGFADYNSYNTSGGMLYTQTSAFRGLMNWAEEYLINNAMFEEPMTLEQYKASQAGKAAAAEYDSLAKKVSDAYDLLESSGIEVFVSSDNSYYYLLPYKTLVYPMDSAGGYVHCDTIMDYYSRGYIERVNPNSRVVESTTLKETQPATQPPIVEQVNEQGEVYTEAVIEQTTRRSDSENNYGVPQIFQGETDVIYVDGNGRYYRFYYATGDTRPPLEVQDVANALDTINSISGYTSYGESTKERFLEEISTGGKEDYIYQAWQNTHSYNHYGRIVNNIKSVNYAVLLEDGRIVTNCGVLATDTEEQILEKLGGEFVEANVKGKYKLLKGEEPAKTDSPWGDIADMLFGESVAILNAGGSLFADPKNSSGYFAYVQRNDVIDPFTLSFNAYTDFTQSSVTNLNTLAVLFAVSFLIACAACIYLLCVAGKTADGIKINFFDRIPAELSWVLGLGVMALLGFGAVVLVCYEADPFQLAFVGVSGNFFGTLFRALSINTALITGIAAAGFFGIWTALNAGFIRNIRNKSFWKHTLCFRLIRLVGWIFKKLGKVFGFILNPTKRFFKKQIEKIKYILACDYAKGEGKKFKIIACSLVAAFLVLNGIVVLLSGATIHYGSGLLGLIVAVMVNISVLMFAVLLIVSLDRIMEAVSAMRRGELNTKIDTRLMPGFMLRFAEDILSMQDGLQNAVESAVKDQRMKAELITNVSHDLKTPLTSIVNYVDLLKKCEVEDETAQRYITVLDEKAAKMKKLIEDLVEASKASSGAIEIHPVKINLTEFAAQAVGEHEDELKKIGIGLVLKAPESFVYVTADSQKTSRIVENLFSNIRKYALEGTRVYVEVESGERYGSLIFKNISRNELNVSGDELIQRFVRGDASRSGEGSGLGLSIANNLCELQKGRFRVDVDGDLFKVTVSLPKAE